MCPGDNDVKRSKLPQKKCEKKSSFRYFFFIFEKLLPGDQIPPQIQCRCTGVFIVNFKHISHLFLVFLLLTLNMSMFAESCRFVNFRQVNVSWRTTMVETRMTLL